MSAVPHGFAPVTDPYVLAQLNYQMHPTIWAWCNLQLQTIHSLLSRPIGDLSIGDLLFLLIPAVLALKIASGVLDARKRRHSP